MLREREYSGEVNLFTVHCMHGWVTTMTPCMLLMYANSKIKFKKIGASLGFLSNNEGKNREAGGHKGSSQNGHWDHPSHTQPWRAQRTQDSGMTLFPLV
jgi:hypothetical protein